MVVGTWLSSLLSLPRRAHLLSTLLFSCFSSNVLVVCTLQAAVEPVWYLPGVAERFGCSESTLRQCLFHETNGMYPELVTRPDLKIFLPPIGGLTVSWDWGGGVCCCEMPAVIVGLRACVSCVASLALVLACGCPLVACGYSLPKCPVSSASLARAPDLHFRRRVHHPQPRHRADGACAR